jgi:hypothetical protein
MRDGASSVGVKPERRLLRRSPSSSGPFRFGRFSFGRFSFGLSFGLLIRPLIGPLIR